ncbi:MAG: FtsW/RodA/SpoVE family cell cycle protein [Lachnospiraceae bacterium]|nr:FtsW/RodA/SpoVE family cell cycle protein [Lachnospiraceae bacterium]
MVLFLIETGKYINIVLAGLYCLFSYISLGRKDEDGRNGVFHILEFITLLLFISGVTDLALAYSYAGDEVAMRNVILLGAAEAAGMFAFARLMYHFYPEMNRLLFADMEFMLCIGFVVLMRLNYRHALRQYVIIAAGLVISMFIPMLIHRLKLIKKMGWICGAAGGAALLIVYIHGSITNGAKLSMKIFGLTFQPSEIIKILFAFFIAGILYKSAGFVKIAIAAASASVLIIILTISRDLGMALIYSVMLIAMIYMASGRIRYVFIGAGAGAAAATAAYRLFSHVRVRFNVWRDPWTDIDNTGYQLTQSLFAIGTGNWFGLGIGRGKPTTIPDVEDDFIFSAIAEESGLIFGIILILVCLNLLIAMLLMVGRVKDRFFRIAGMGMAVCYGIQTVLTIGGGTMLIPLTGVTLPLVSNGGSSAMATLLLFAVLQGISLIRMDEIYDGVSAESEDTPLNNDKTESKKENKAAHKKEKPVKEKKNKKEQGDGRRRAGKNEINESAQRASKNNDAKNIAAAGALEVAASAAEVTAAEEAVDEVMEETMVEAMGTATGAFATSADETGFSGDIESDAGDPVGDEEYDEEDFNEEDFDDEAAEYSDGEDEKYDEKDIDEEYDDDEEEYAEEDIDGEDSDDDDDEYFGDEDEEYDEEDIDDDEYSDDEDEEYAEEDIDNDEYSCDEDDEYDGEDLDSEDDIEYDEKSATVFPDEDYADEIIDDDKKF